MDDEDTIELTITKGFFKKSANYFVGVRMLGHAGKVKTELIEDTTSPIWKNNTFAFAVPEGRLTPDTELIIRFGAFIALKDSPKYDAEKTDKREKFEKILIETERL